MASSAYASMDCVYPVAKPQPVSSTDPTLYCEYADVWCTNIQENLFARFLDSFSTGNNRTVEGSLTGRCDTNPDGKTCPTPSECLDPASKKSRLSSKIRKALDNDAKLEEEAQLHKQEASQ